MYFCKNYEYVFLWNFWSAFHSKIRIKFAENFRWKIRKFSGKFVDYQQKLGNVRKHVWCFLRCRWDVRNVVLSGAGQFCAWYGRALCFLPTCLEKLLLKIKSSLVKLVLIWGRELFAGLPRAVLWDIAKCLSNSNGLSFRNINKTSQKIFLFLNSCWTRGTGCVMIFISFFFIILLLFFF